MKLNNLFLTKYPGKNKRRADEQADLSPLSAHGIKNVNS